MKFTSFYVARHDNGVYLYSMNRFCCVRKRIDVNVGDNVFAAVSSAYARKPKNIRKRLEQSEMRDKIVTLFDLPERVECDVEDFTLSVAISEAKYASYLVCVGDEIHFPGVGVTSRVPVKRLGYRGDFVVALNREALTLFFRRDMRGRVRICFNNYGGIYMGVTALQSNVVFKTDNADMVIAPVTVYEEIFKSITAVKSEVAK